MDYHIFHHTHNVDNSHDQVVSNNQSLTEEPIEENDSQFKDSLGSGYKMLGDNFDKTSEPSTFDWKVIQMLHCIYFTCVQLRTE